MTAANVILSYETLVKQSVAAVSACLVRKLSLREFGFVACV